MVSVELFSLLILIGFMCRYGAKCEDNLPEPCAVEDTECQNKSLEEMLQIMSAGAPQYNIEPIDPMSVDAVNIPVCDHLELHFKNTRIKGFSGEKISNFKFDKEARTMSYNGEDNLIIAGDVTAHYPGLDKSLSGTHTTTADVRVNVAVTYDLETDEHGLQHFTFGPASITCEASDVHYTLNDELDQAKNYDAEIMKLNGKLAEKKAEVNQKIICKLVEAGYQIIEENFRSIAKLVPTSALFSNL